MASKLVPNLLNDIAKVSSTATDALNLSAWSADPSASPEQEYTSSSTRITLANATGHTLTLLRATCEDGRFGYEDDEDFIPIEPAATLESLATTTFVAAEDGEALGVDGYVVYKSADALGSAATFKFRVPFIGSNTFECGGNGVRVKWMKAPKDGVHVRAYGLVYDPEFLKAKMAEEGHAKVVQDAVISYLERM